MASLGFGARVLAWESLEGWASAHERGLGEG